MDEKKKKELIEKCREKISKSLKGFWIKACILEMLAIGVVYGCWYIREVSSVPFMLSILNLLRQSHVTHLLARATKIHNKFSSADNFEILKSVLINVKEKRTKKGKIVEYIFEKNLTYIDTSLKLKFEKGKEYFLCVRRDKLEDEDGNIRFLNPKLIEVFEEEKKSKEN